MMPFRSQYWLIFVLESLQRGFVHRADVDVRQLAVGCLLDKLALLWTHSSYLRFASDATVRMRTSRVEAPSGVADTFTVTYSLSA